jgi:hypothetical protein
MTPLTQDELKAVATYLWGSPRKWQDDSRANGLSLVASGFTVLWIAGRKYFDYAEALLSPDGRGAMEAAIREKGLWLQQVTEPRGIYTATIMDSEGIEAFAQVEADTHAEALARAILEVKAGGR